MTRLLELVELEQRFLVDLSGEEFDVSLRKRLRLLHLSKRCDHDVSCDRLQQLLLRKVEILVLGSYTQHNCVDRVGDEAADDGV